MGKRPVYGGRWKKEPGEKEGEGGQAQVFRVRDITSGSDEIFALKRVTNLNRRDRFLDEVESIQRLNHPNIIRILDHSSLGETDSGEKQFIVMPFAAGGSLSKRRQIYKNNVAATLEIALQLAEALQAAHSEKVIHRDVKPENILFRGDDNHVWLADFGIARIEDYPRHTGDGEIVGPAHYIAPELERTGQHHVTPAADVYSLGKVIYYALSGGVTIRREDLHDPNNSAIFGQGEQFRLLQGLLSRMVCALPSRIKTMEAVIAELKRIKEWPLTARVPIPSETISAIDTLRAKIIKVQDGRQKNEEIVRRRREITDQTIKAIADLITNILRPTAEAISDPNGLNAGIRHVTKNGADLRLADRKAELGIEMWVTNDVQRNNLEHVLRFSLCRAQASTLFILHSDLEVPKIEDEFEDIFVVPTYKTDQHEGLHKRMFWDYFDSDGNIFFPAHLPEKAYASVGLNTKDRGLEAEAVSQQVTRCVTLFMKKIGGSA